MRAKVKIFAYRATALQLTLYVQLYYDLYVLKIKKLTT